MTIDEIAAAGVTFVQDALLEKGVKFLSISHHDNGPQIRFRIEVDGQDWTFGADIEPFVPVREMP
jgi:hypothetical protein